MYEILVKLIILGYWKFWEKAELIAKRKDIDTWGLQKVENTRIRKLEFKADAEFSVNSKAK